MKKILNHEHAITCSQPNFQPLLTSSSYTLNHTKPFAQTIHAHILIPFFGMSFSIWYHTYFLFSQISNASSCILLLSR